jgi:hypothetical protein
MDFPFVVNVPDTIQTEGVYWLQGFFKLGKKKRIATVSDIKFFTDTKLIIAHRAAAKLYLAEYSIDNKLNVLSTLELNFNNYFFHPDLFDIYDNKIYLTDYTNIICIVEIKNDALFYVKSIVLHEYVKYHGIYCNKEIVFVGGVRNKDKNTILTVYNSSNDEIKHIKTNLDRRIKSISSYGKDKLILCVDFFADYKNNLVDSSIMLYSLENDKLLLLDFLNLNNYQLDGMAFNNNHFFVTANSIDDECSYIIVGNVDKQKKLNLIKKVHCHDFPHGIDIRNNLLAYTSYAKSSVTFQLLSNYI